MCKECGCEIPGEVSLIGPDGRRSVLEAGTEQNGKVAPAHDQHEHGGKGSHAHRHEQEEHASGPNDAAHAQVVRVQQSLLTKNDRLAERNRGFFRAKRLLVLNVLSSPGSGKTTLIEKTAVAGASRFRTGVIVGDLATQNDANRLRSAGVPVVQINTGTMCHLDASMVEQACAKLAMDKIDLLIIENVGNLVCPAAYDLGENLRVVLLSVTEGEDKPLKYPPAFHSADVAIVTKCDLAEHTGWDRAAALANLRRISHHATILELSARTGEGMGTWLDFLSNQLGTLAGPTH